MCKLFYTVSFLLAMASATVKAQTSVYVCSGTGAFGYCYGDINVAQCAYNKCIAYGGTSPYQVVSYNGKGYGAIAVGWGENGRRIVGAAAGYSNLEDAKRRALSECSNYGSRNPSIHTYWLDR